jgi:hypothetical protein
MKRSFLGLLFVPALAAASPDGAYQLETTWGSFDGAVLVARASEPSPAADLDVPQAPPRSTDVTPVLLYQPRVPEPKPYEPDIRMNDTVTNVLIVTGGAALITSIIVEMLR